MSRTLTAVIFDLDNTLVGTTSLRKYREEKRFQEITDEMIAKTKCYRPVVALLRKLREKKVKIGVVTNSPKKYAERLLKHHALIDLIDTLVAYDDVGSAGKKPSPLGIRLAITKLKIPDNQLSRTAYVGDEYIDVTAAYRAGIIPLVSSWASRESVTLPPAAEVSSGGLLEMADGIDEYLLFAERCAERRSTDFNRKAARFLPIDQDGNVATIVEKLDTFCLGRYFGQRSPTTARLHDNHALSREIAKKDNKTLKYTLPTWAEEMMAKVILASGQYLFEKDDIDIVTVIPGKKNKHPRLEIFLNGIEKLVRSTGRKIDFRSDLLYFDDGAAQSIRGMSASSRHAELEKNLLSRGTDLSGKNVLVIDDVITTGATIGRAIALLREARAKSVHGVSIAKTVSIPEDTKVCPACGRDMLIRKNGTSGIRFWSCAGFHDNKSCTHSEPFEKIPCPKCGRDMVLRQNRYKKTLFWSCTGYNQTPKCIQTLNHRND